MDADARYAAAANRPGGAREAVSAFELLQGLVAFSRSPGPYIPQHVPPANLNNTPRIGQLLHEGKLMLSMDDAVALALENNLDLVIARYTLSIADTDVLRAKSGANMILGTPLGVVQNTPGGEWGGSEDRSGLGRGVPIPVQGERARAPTG